MIEEFYLEAIIAIADNNAIGYQGTLPWHIPSELQLFKSITLHYPLIMGRGTFESLGAVLPQRDHIVISSHDLPTQPSLFVVRTIEEAISKAKELHSEKAMIIGGKSIFETVLNTCKRLHCTRVHLHPKADIFYEIPFDKWKCVYAAERVEDKTSEISYTYQIWENNY